MRRQLLDDTEVRGLRALGEPGELKILVHTLEK